MKTLFHIQKSFLLVATSLGRSFFCCLKGLQLYERGGFQFSSACNLFLWQSHFLQCSLQFTLLSNKQNHMKHNNVVCFKSSLILRSPIPPGPHRKVSVSGYDKVRRKAPTWRAWENSQHFVMPPLAFPPKWCLRNERRNSVLMRYHYQELGSLSDG